MTSDKISSDQTTSQNPWWILPTLYFAEGLPYVLINSVSVIIYKRMGIDNAQITSWTGLLYLPWVIKMFWSPFVDSYSTKRNWVICTQIGLMLCLGAAAFSLQLPNFFFISLLIFTIGAFISATQDIATDGFYMLALTPEQQAFYAGIRSVFYRMATVFGIGGLVVFAGQLEENLGNIPLSWSITLIIAAVIFGVIFIYHRFVLPFPDSDAPNRRTEEQNQIPFVTIISSYFQQPKILAILAFILLYRFGEAMLVKLANPFLLDPISDGGLGLTTKEVGLVYGTFGTISLIVGGIIGGAIVSKFGLKKTILPLALALNLPDLFYVYMAYNQPSIELVYPLVSLEQFGYGLGFTSFMVYLIYVSKGEYKTSHYAISTGIMALGMMVLGMVSGFIQQSLGYPLFFVVVCFLTIPGMATIFFLPISED
ncbi:MAG: AmpG family muropeptide MFS transporter [Symploca sp. SIO2E6]|nr:AmpG family muropeptide MFS transporter [Symploca sp. SIO2E6]